VFSQWNTRYIVLDGDKLHFYADSTKKVLKKTLDLSTDVTTVCFHYDENAPELSKKMGVKGEKDESRFDVYVKKPFPRKYMLKTGDDKGVWEAEDWVNTL
jgi:hypothetical protein